MIELSRLSRAVPMIASALTLLALPCVATTWIVDDDGGPGVNFTDIPAALAAASPKDLILVKPGSYSGFTVLQAQTIIGEPGSSSGEVLVDMVAGKVLLAGLGTGSLTVRNCAKTVILDGLTIKGETGPFPGSAVLVEFSPDVRFVDCTVTGNAGTFIDEWGSNAMRVEGSRVELTGSNLQGGGGGNTTCFEGGSGGDGLRMLNASTVHAARSSVRAGKGGNTKAVGCVADAGDGGDAIRATGGGALILSGLTGDEIAAGDGGSMSLGSLGYCGDGGDAINLCATPLRRSGVTQIRGSAGCGGFFGGDDGQGVVLGCGATQTFGNPADPTLERLNTPAPGAPVFLEVQGDPGAVATLFLSRLPQVQPTAGAVGDLLLAKMRTISLGVIPASGFITKTINLPPSWPTGMLVMAQAECLYPGSELRRTNSVPLILR